MITKQVIDNIYKQYKSKPKSPDELSISLLFEYAIDHHGIYIDDGDLVIDSVGEDSPFHTIALDRIHAILEFERVIAIVLRNAIVFLNKKDDGAHIHIKAPRQSIFDRIREAAKGEVHPDF